MFPIDPLTGFLIVMTIVLVELYEHAYYFIDNLLHKWNNRKEKKNHGK